MEYTVYHVYKRHTISAHHLNSYCCPLPLP